MTRIVAQFEVPSTEELFVWPCLGGSADVPGIGTVCVNRVVILLLLATFVVGLLFYLAFRNPRVVPGKLQLVMEAGVEFIRNQVILQMIGPEGLRFLPYLTTLFFFILLGNILEVIPGINFPVNSRLAFPAVLAAVSWVVYNYQGIKHRGFFGYLRSVLFPPGVPKPMYLLLTPVEFFSVIIVRPFTLTIRLTANMVAGHVILTVFFLGTAALLQPSITAVFSVVSFALAVVLVGFEIFVSTLQAFIFAILTASYIAGAVEAEH